MALRNLVTRKSLSATAQAFRQQLRGLQTFTLPDLPYDYGALEPAISGEIMQLHHQKHHQAYVTNYNKALEQLHEAISKGDVSAAVKLQSAIKFNGGGPSLSLFIRLFTAVLFRYRFRLCLWSVIVVKSKVLGTLFVGSSGFLGVN